MATGQSIATEAFKQLANSITVTDQQSFLSTTVEDVWQAVRDIERDQAARRDLRFMRRVEPFITTMDSYSEILTILCQGWPPMSFIWGPIKWIFVLAKNYSEIIDTLLQAYKDIAENLPRIDLLRRTFPDNENMNRTIGLIYSDVLEFHGRAYKMFRRKFWHIYFTFDWGFYKKRFKSVLQMLSQHRDLLDKEAAAAHFEAMRTFRDQRNEEDEAFEKKRLLDKFREVIGWLSGSEDAQEDYLDQISEKRLLETCNWILKDPEVSRWVDYRSDSSTLWLTGIPGSGKSFLASMIIEHVQRYCAGCCAYFFCGHSNSTDVTCVNILSTFSTQILRQNMDMAPLVHEAFLQKGSGRTVAAMKRLLAHILPEIQFTHFVLDGLDELGSSIQRETLKSLQDVFKNANGKSGLLVSSRDEPQIRKFSFQNRIRLDGKTTEAVDLYIQDNIKRLRSSHEFIDDQLSSDIETNLLKMAGGMFLWVRLVFAMLSEKGTYAEIKNAINDLPDGLDEAYSRILFRFENQKTQYVRKRVFRILSWLCVGQRPISIHEVTDGIALSFKQRKLSRETRISNPDRDILDLCAPLLEKKPLGIIGLVHFSAKEYLVSVKSGPFLNETLSNFHIARACIINLITGLDFISPHSNLNDKDLETRTTRGTYGLIGYSSKFWVNHLLSYLSESDRLPLDRKQGIFDLLQSLCQLTKPRVRQGLQSDPQGLSGRHMKGLKELDHEPKLSRLVASYLDRPQKLGDLTPDLANPEQQEQRISLSDDTFMTLIACRLRDTTNHILTMTESTLPSHIEPVDYRAFVHRFGWRCKYVGCCEEFKSEFKKSMHEEGHVISFPCSYCDFFSMGFRSRKQLERHVKSYHLDPSDLEVPTSLRLNHNEARRIPGDDVSHRRQLKCWNDQGLKAAKEVLRQTLKHVNSTLEERTSGSDMTAIDKSQSLATDVLRQKIDQEQFESLEGFKRDLRQILGGTDNDDRFLMNHHIEIACQKGLRNTTATYPEFSNLEGSISTNQVFVSGKARYPNKLDTEMELQDDVKITYSNLLEKTYRIRDAHWSKLEEIEFPNLLGEFGSNFSKIAEKLGTKSEDDIDRFYACLMKKRPDIGEIVRDADLKIENMQQKDHEQAPAVGTTESMQLEPSLAMNSQPASVLATGMSEMIPSQTLKDSLASPYSEQRPVINAPSTSAGETGDTSSKLPTRKRRERPRAYCRHCTFYKDGLHDEYARQKHEDRYHKHTRKVWTSDDKSIDKSFFQGCDDCKIGKRYKTKYEAVKHLKLIHFAPDTTPQTLNRWLREYEEPNPSFGLDPGEKPPRQLAPSKRQKNDKELIRIAPLDYAIEENPLLPPMRKDPESTGADGTMPLKSDHDSLSTEVDRGFGGRPLSSNPSNSIPDITNHGRSPLAPNQGDSWGEMSIESINSSPTSVSSESFAGNFETESKVNKKPDADFVLPDVSFDNLIGRGILKSSYDDMNGPPHRSSQALIKPDQVSRLPHLDQARKVVCSDQVVALYYRLDEEEPQSREYKDQLAKLEAVSRALMRNLKDWQREQSHAPNIPFSLDW